MDVRNQVTTCLLHALFALKNEYSIPIAPVVMNQTTELLLLSCRASCQLVVGKRKILTTDVGRSSREGVIWSITLSHASSVTRVKLIENGLLYV